MKSLKGKVAAITGAASGIGQALAVELAAEGCHLALCDLNEEGLRETAAACSGVTVSTHRVNVADQQDVARYAREAREEHGGVDLIVNNAGILTRAKLEHHTYEEIEQVLAVNLWGVIYGVKEFLPLLRQRPEGHIVNVSSINAAVPFPSNAPYNISKYAIAGLSDTLIQDLADDPIHITCVHPGGVKTRLLPNAGLDKKLVADFDKITMTTSAHAARKIVKGIKRNKQRLVVGADAELLFALKRLLPMTTVRLVGRLLEKGPHGHP